MKRCGAGPVLAMTAAMLAPHAAFPSPYCAHTSAELAAVLADVSDSGIANGQDNVIHLVAGTFSAAGSRFSYSSTSGYALVLDGGYDATCTTQDPKPGLSKLDGGGANQVLSIQTNGNISVRHLLIQNGLHNGSDGGGAQIALVQTQASDPAPTLVFANNVVRNNSSNYAVGGLAVFLGKTGSTATVYVENNLFVGNTAPAAGALFVDLGAGSTAYLTNNTITGNTSSNPDASTTALGDPSGAITGYVSNTISYANAAAHDFYLYTNTVQFNNNDYDNIRGTPAVGSAGNVTNVDPQFVATGNYDLKPASALHGIGRINPAGGLPLTDIASRPRSFAGKVDLGAHQNGDGIFANGFGASAP